MNEQQIAHNITLIRGDKSQTKIANRMAERGHKWTQSTLSAIERGDRSLKLTEAIDLANILDVPLSVLASSGASHEDQRNAAVKASITRAQNSFNKVRDELLDFLNSYENLRDEVSAALAEGNSSHFVKAGVVNLEELSLWQALIDTTAKIAGQELGDHNAHLAASFADHPEETTTSVTGVALSKESDAYKPYEFIEYPVTQIERDS